MSQSDPAVPGAVRGSLEPVPALSQPQLPVSVLKCFIFFAGSSCFPIVIHCDENCLISSPE